MNRRGRVQSFQDYRCFHSDAIKKLCPCLRLSSHTWNIVPPGIGKIEEIPYTYARTFETFLYPSPIKQTLYVLETPHVFRYCTPDFRLAKVNVLREQKKKSSDPDLENVSFDSFSFDYENRDRLEFAKVVDTRCVSLLWSSI